MSIIPQDAIIIDVPNLAYVRRDLPELLQPGSLQYETTLVLLREEGTFLHKGRVYDSLKERNILDRLSELESRVQVKSTRDLFYNAQYQPPVGKNTLYKYGRNLWDWNLAKAGYVYDEVAKTYRPQKSDYGHYVREFTVSPGDIFLVDQYDVKTNLRLAPNVQRKSKNQGTNGVNPDGWGCRITLLDTNKEVVIDYKYPIWVNLMQDFKGLQFTVPENVTSMVVDLSDARNNPDGQRYNWMLQWIPEGVQPYPTYTAAY